MNIIARFFLSLNTAFFLFLSFILLLVTGSFSLVRNLAFFSGIDETPLFRWLSETNNLMITWWIYIMITMLTLLAISTIFCTAEALLKKMARKRLIEKISPQIMHIGVLFIMLGHLLTASAGFRTDLLIKKGEEKPVAEGNSVLIEEVKAYTDANGYQTDLEVKLWWLENNRKIHQKILKPVHPLYFGQFGLYIKSVTSEPEPAALIRVCKDPGALWALIGGILLSAGGLGFIYGKFRGEQIIP